MSLDFGQSWRREGQEEVEGLMARQEEEGGEVRSGRSE